MPKVVRAPSDVLAEDPRSTQSEGIKVSSLPVEAPKYPEAGFRVPEQEQEPEKPKTATAPAVSEAERPTATAKGLYRFVKNINPNEKIRFPDGTEFQFKGPKFVTSDLSLAEKLIAVGNVYNIVQQ